MGSGDSTGEHQDRLTLMAPSNQTAVLRPPKKEGAEISPRPDGAGQNQPPKRILEIAYAFWRSKALLSAVELGVFTMLAEGPLDLATLTRRIGIHERGARDFFDALVALGALRRDADGRYGNDPEFDLYLDRRKPTYLGGLLEHLNARHLSELGSAHPGAAHRRSPKRRRRHLQERSTMAIRCRRYS